MIMNIPPKSCSGTTLPAAADGPVAPRPPSPASSVLIPSRAWQHVHGCTSATFRLAPSLQVFMLKGETGFHED